MRALRRLTVTLEPLNRVLLLLYLDERSRRKIVEIMGRGSSTKNSTASTKLHSRNRLVNVGIVERVYIHDRPVTIFHLAT